MSTRQKVQAILLYYVAPLEHLKGFQQRLRELAASGRCGNGRQLLADFELPEATDIAKRAYQTYSITGANQCGPGMAKLMPSPIARNTLTSRPCNWIFVEQIQGELCGIHP